MLSVERSPGEAITIGEATVLVQQIGDGSVRLLVSAPLHVPVRRGPPAAVPVLPTEVNTRQRRRRVVRRAVGEGDGG